mmetsp:Transcript_103803/g.332672  ORF Transcript_103803/g.332672 Transcript_103803/m.332672 type:complete len:204 (+) Transcript_103803:924-1535(+)
MPQQTRSQRPHRLSRAPRASQASQAALPPCRCGRRWATPPRWRRPWRPPLVWGRGRCRGSSTPWLARGARRRHPTRSCLRGASAALHLHFIPACCHKFRCWGLAFRRCLLVQLTVLLAFGCRCRRRPRCLLVLCQAPRPSSRGCRCWICLLRTAACVASARAAGVDPAEENEEDTVRTAGARWMSRLRSCSATNGRNPGRRQV